MTKLHALLLARGARRKNRSGRKKDASAMAPMLQSRGRIRAARYSRNRCLKDRARQISCYMAIELRLCVAKEGRAAAARELRDDPDRVSARLCARRK